MNENKTNINWYPGHMAKTKRILRENKDLIDVVLEVIDARMPYSSKLQDVDDILHGKPHILIVNKMDLCDIKETTKWINYYRNHGYIVVPLEKNGNLNELLNKIKDVLKDVNDKRLAKGMKIRKARATIIGIPNVGKSTLINRLVDKKVVEVGNKPGITKNVGWIRVNDKLELLDTPGILWPKIENITVAFNLASLSSIKEEILPLDEVATYILKMLDTYYPAKLQERYKIKDIDFTDIVQTFDEIGKKRGLLLKGGYVDYDRVIKVILNDIKLNYITGITFDRYGDDNE